MSAHPLLIGENRDRALRAVEAVCVALCGELDLGDDLSVSSGRAGLALGLHALATGLGDSRAEASALRWLDEALDRLEQVRTAPWLYAGYSGVAWAADQIAQRRGWSRDLVDEVDEALAEALDVRAWREDWDLMYGLVGYGWYALHRPPSDATRRVQAGVARHLRGLARLERGGAHLWTPGALLDLRAGEGGHADQEILGLAHGSPAALILLAAQGEDDALVAALGEGLVGHRGADGSWPAWVSAAGPVHGWRCAWCYGDPGVALALHAAGSRLGRADWLTLSEQVALGAARAWLAGEPPREAGLCHGAAGAGLQFIRFHHIFEQDLLQDAAHCALQQALALWRPGQGCGGFQALTRQPDGTVGLSADPGLLSGALGVALVLAEACGATLPPWDRILMTSPVQLLPSEQR